MSNEYSTAISLGAKAPFILVMKLSRKERIAFMDTVSPTLLAAQKNALLKGA